MGFLSKIRKGMKKQVAQMPRRPGMIGDMRFRGEMPRRGGFGNLRNLIRRLKEQRDMGMPRMPSVDDGRVYAGGSPGLYKPGGRFYNPEARLQMPQPIPIPERMRVGRFEKFTSNAPSFNPKFFSQLVDNIDFSQMPQPIPRAEIDISALERLPMGNQPMPQDLPEVESVGMMPQMGMRDMQPRMMMQAGDEVSPEQEIFSLQAQLKNLKEQLRLDRSYNNDQAVINTSAEMSAIQKRIQEILQESGRTMSDLDRALMGGRTISDKARRAIEAGKGSAVLDIEGRPQLAGGGDFPDLTGDGKVTQADILKGRGVYAEGDEVMMMEETEMMAPGGDEIEASLMEVQGMQPELQALDQYVQMVIEMVQAGASEAEVIESLRQAGLDDEDIEALFQAVMETLQSNMEQGGIDAELAQLS